MADRYVWVGEISYYNIHEKEDMIFGAKRNAIAWIEQEIPDIKWKDPDPERPDFLVGETDREHADEDVLGYVIRRKVN